MKYRKKPVVIEAVQFIGLDERFGNMRFRDSSPDWIEKAQLLPSEEEGSLNLRGGDVPVIRTLEGDHGVNVGDWIIRGVAGEIYPCKPDIFARTYEPVE